MPALNIKFTDEELARVRAGAHAENLSLSHFTHKLIMGHVDSTSRDSEVMAAASRVIGLSQDLLKRLADR